ncbi:MAG: CRISPR-associated protein Csp1 family [Bacteroidota bacterium]|jgi:CRISPR-associated protein Cst2
MENIKGILVSMLVPMENHMANGGEKILGNASSVKRRPDERVYISGQMQRHALFSAMERINLTDAQKGETFVANGDGVSNMIERDLRADMGGFLHTSKGDYSGRRIAPLTVTPAVALDPSQVGRDLLVRLKMNEGGEKDQALATKEFSESDMMHMNFFLDITTLSISKAFKYENEFHIQTVFFKHATEAERKRRVRLFLEATRSINDYANMARNAVSGEPQQVLIVFDPKLSRKGSRYFVAETKEQTNLLEELNDRNAQCFIGNDLDGDVSVNNAYKSAFALLESSTLFDPSNGASVKTFKEVFEK